MADDDLDRPREVDDLYLERGDPAPPWRPILTGDIFSDLPIPGLDVSDLTMIVAHPCTMRAGASLVERLQAVPVRPYNAVPLEQWPAGHKRAFPLPDLSDGTPVAAKLNEFGMVKNADLDLDHRVACLSEEGIRLLLQRFFACFGRVTVRLDTIGEALLGPLGEAELLEEWNEKLVAPAVTEGAERGPALEAAAVDFDALLGADGGGGKPLRADLESAETAAAVRRSVRAELSRRMSS